jgi:hypothetical protein
MRPALGAASGIVVYLLLGSGLVPLSSEDPTHVSHLYAVLAFAGGFSEQLVPDALGLANRQLSDPTV